MSLPSIQHFESHGGMPSHAPPPPSQAAHQLPHPPSYAPVPPPPPYPPSQYHPYQNGTLPAPMQPALAPNGQDGMMRFAIPPQHLSPLSRRTVLDSRHKKDIKRRTKTGCLTCRKRRIKCDEGHPTCRNCLKSKRECLGYDPIFKQQSPANIQPAPSSGNTTPVATSSHTHGSAHEQGDPASNLAAATASTDASHRYPASQPYPPAGATFNSSISAAAPGADGQFDPGNPLDPALASGGQSLAMTQNHCSHALQPQRKVKPMSVDELFALHDITPRYQTSESPSPIADAIRDTVESFYRFHYAVGLDRLFETTWYSTHGLTHLLSDPALQHFVAQCAEQFKAKTEDKALLSLEARLVWQLAIMPRTAAVAISDDPAHEALIEELLPRVDTIENLLTGQFLEPSKVPLKEVPSTADASEASPESGEHLFWHLLGRFVALRDDLATPSVLRDADDMLQELRDILCMQENRDVLYSVAIVRHVGGRMPEFHPHRQLVASTADQNDDVNKLRIAHEFLESEDQHGTTQVIQRLCSMAIRSGILQKQ